MPGCPDRFPLCTVRKLLAPALVIGLAGSLQVPAAAANDDLIRLGVGMGMQLLQNELEKNRQPPPPGVRENRNDARKSPRATREEARSSKAPKLSNTNVVMMLQARLTDLGFDPGPVDGGWGSRTEAALKMWQASIGDAPTGVLTDPQRVALFGTTDPGGTKGGDEVAMKAGQPAGATQAKAQPDKRDWYGHIACEFDRKKIAGQVEFHVSRRDQGHHIDMVVYRPGRNEGAGSYLTYLGEKVPGQQGRWNFVVNKRVTRDIGALFPGNFTLDGDPLGDGPVSGTFSNGPCQSFEAKPLEQWPSRLESTVARPADGGTFWSKPTWREKCEAVIAWTDRLQAEYPGHDFDDGNRDGENMQGLLLFADDDFVPVFGKPFDETNYDTRHTILMDTYEHCGRDPFTRDRIGMFKNPAIDSRFRDRDHEGDFQASVFEVRDVRRVRNEIRALAKQEQQGAAGPFEDVAASLTGMRERISRPSAIWPSEKEQALALIDERLAALGRAEAQRRLAEIAGAATPAARLELAKESLADSDLAYWKFLPSSEQDVHLRKLEDAGAQNAEALAGPLTAIVKSASRDLAGMALIETAAESGLDGIRELSQADRQRFAAEFERERDNRLAELLSQREAEFSAFPAGRTGLVEGKAWWERLTREFQNYAGHPRFAQTTAAFLADRAERLKAAVAEFEAAVRAGGDASELVNAYLGLPHDRESPVSLDYLFVIAQNR